MLPWMCWDHCGACETLARVQGSASHPSGAAWGKGCRQGPEGQQQALAASGGSTVSGWASGPGGSSSGRFEPQWVHVGHVIVNLSPFPHCETHSMSLLNTIDPQAGGPTLTAGGSAEHEEQEGALCLTLSWGAHGFQESARGFGVPVSEHGAMPGSTKWVRRVVGMLSSPSPIPPPDLQDPILRVLSSPSLTPPRSCGHRGWLCLVISPGLPAWLPAGGHGPAGVTQDLPLGPPVQLQPRPQPACGFLESCRDGAGGDKEGARRLLYLLFQGPPSRGGQGSPCPYPRPLPQPPWTTSSHSVGRATRWPCGCGWTTPRTTSTRGE